MKKYTIKPEYGKYIIGFMVGIFCFTALFSLMYIGFGGLSIQLVKRVEFWIAFIVSVSLAYAIIKTWVKIRSSFGFTDAVLSLITAFFAFWLTTYLVINISRLV